MEVRRGVSVAMSERYWSGPIAFMAFGLILLAVWSYIIWTISAERQNYADTANHHSRRASENAEAEFENCFKLRSGIYECAAGVAFAEHEVNRAEQDLAAQKEMAYWTPWIALSSIATAVAAVVGLGSLAYQNNLAREAAFQAQRAWLRVEPELVSGITRNADGQMRVGVTLEIENLGVAPANNAIIHLKAFGDPPINAARMWISTLESEAAEMSKKSPLGQTIFKGRENRYRIKYDIPISDPDPEIFGGMPGGIHIPLFVALIIVVAYRTPGDARVSTTTRVFDIRKLSRAAMMMDDIPIPLEQLVLSQSFVTGQAQ